MVKNLVEEIKQRTGIDDVSFIFSAVSDHDTIIRVKYGPNGNDYAFLYFMGDTFVGGNVADVAPRTLDGAINNINKIKETA